MLTRLQVKNFKSLKNFEVEFKQFNVLIGPNGSGKTNVLELLKFTNLYMSSQKTPMYPFAEWNGYKNMVWWGKEQEMIDISINYEIKGHEIQYKAGINGSNNRLEITHENLWIKDYIYMSTDIDSVNYSFQPAFREQIKSILNDPSISRISNMQQRSLDENFSIKHNDKSRSILRFPNWHELAHRNEDAYMLRTVMVRNNVWNNYAFLSPAVKNDHTSLYTAAANYMIKNNIVMLRQLNYDELRLAAPINYPASLDEDGLGLVNLLFSWFVKNQKLPDTIILALEELFPGWQISFQVTENTSDIIMNVSADGLMLAPTSIPDGFYKMLAILAAIELRPEILLVDEIESSLHLRIIEYILDLLREMDSTTVIITTHSPLVIDSVNIEDLIVMSNTKHESTCRKIENVSELKQDLIDRGITVSESWLYGKL